MIDALQLRHEIIRPVLKYLDAEIPYSKAAENLLMGTCAQESKMGQWLVQLGDGPAKGIFQMEPTTLFDIYANFLKYKSDLRDVVNDLRGSRDFILDHGTVEQDDLTGNLYYAAAMCRVHYYRVPWPLPDDDVEQLAHYWKNFYNTAEGKGEPEEFVKNYRLLVA